MRIWLRRLLDNYCILPFKVCSKDTTATSSSSPLATLKPKDSGIVAWPTKSWTVSSCEEDSAVFQTDNNMPALLNQSICKTNALLFGRLTLFDCHISTYILTFTQRWCSCWSSSRLFKVMISIARCYIACLYSSKKGETDIRTCRYAVCSRKAEHVHIMCDLPQSTM